MQDRDLLQLASPCVMAASTGPEWAVFVNSGRAFWGIHIDGPRLDAAAGFLAASLIRHEGAQRSTDERAATAALGMPLAYLSFHAKLNLWLDDQLEVRVPDNFDAAVASVSSLELQHGWSEPTSLAGLLLQSVDKLRTRNGALGFKGAQVIARFMLEEEMSRDLVCKALASAEVVRWARHRRPSLSGFVRTYLDWRPLPDQVAHVGWRVGLTSSDGAIASLL